MTIPWFAFLLFGLSWLAASPAASPCQHDRERVKIQLNSKAEFFRFSGRGALAAMPNVAKHDQAPHEHEYLVFRDSGRYGIAARRQWFVVNHTSSEGGASPSYLGVLVATVASAPLRSRLELFRSEGWRPEGNFAEVYEAADDFWRLQDGPDDELAAFEEHFGPWHAARQGGPDSWSARREWVGPDPQCMKVLLGGEEVDPSRLLVQAYLLAFDAADTINVLEPVVWSVNFRNVEAAYIRTFSPESTDFAREYYFSVND